jgi:hypothetical protein
MATAPHRSNATAPGEFHPANTTGLAQVMGSAILGGLKRARTRPIDDPRLKELHQFELVIKQLREIAQITAEISQFSASIKAAVSQDPGVDSVQFAPLGSLDQVNMSRRSHQDRLPLRA